MAAQMGIRLACKTAVLMADQTVNYLELVSVELKDLMLVVR